MRRQKVVSASTSMYVFLYRAFLVLAMITAFMVLLEVVLALKYLKVVRSS